ncbi:hypothetical protein SGI36_21270, partial [Providencia rettgeri]
ETTIYFLALALFLLKVSAELSLPLYLPTNETFGLELGNTSAQCGKQGGGGKCPTGECCSLQGLCGTTPDFCDPNNCQSNCSGPFPQGRCGWQADGAACPTGQCCSTWGWCGTSSVNCDPETCQSQCKKPSPHER